MNRKAFWALFLCSSVIWTLGNGLIPILPLYALELGASHSQVGAYMAISFGFLALGGLLGGRLVNLLKPKSLLLITGLISVVLSLAIALASSLFALVVLTSALWCLGGIGFSALNSIAASIFKEASRGRGYSLLAITSPLGAIIGGIACGPIIDAYGYQALFSVIALFVMFWPICAMTLPGAMTGVRAEIKNSRNVHSDNVHSGSEISKTGVNIPITLILCACCLVFVANFLGMMGMSLSMNSQGMSASEISSTSVVGGLVAIPLVVGIGQLSDYLGRNAAWALCCVAGVLALLLLSNASSLSMYWLIASLLRVLSAGSRGIGNAWILDISSTQFRDKALALFMATTSLGGVLGFLIGGYAIQTQGMGMTFLWAMLLPFFSILLVYLNPTRSASGIRQ